MKETRRVSFQITAARGAAFPRDQYLHRNDVAARQKLPEITDRPRLTGGKLLESLCFECKTVSSVTDEISEFLTDYTVIKAGIKNYRHADGVLLTLHL